MSKLNIDCLSVPQRQVIHDYPLEDLLRVVHMKPTDCECYELILKTYRRYGRGVTDLNRQIGALRYASVQRDTLTALRQEIENARMQLYEKYPFLKGNVRPTHAFLISAMRTFLTKEQFILCVRTAHTNRLQTFQNGGSEIK